MTGQNLIIRSNDISKITSYSIDQTLVRVMAALGAAIVANAGKVAQMTGAVDALDAQGWSDKHYKVLATWLRSYCLFNPKFRHVKMQTKVLSPAGFS